MLYAIADSHGFLGSLKVALTRIRADGGADAPVVFLGDYVDRGPDSRGVIDLLIGGLDKGRPWTCLMGNHDRMFARFLDDATHHDDHILSHKSWLSTSLGGARTLESYGIADAADRPVAEVHAEARDKVPAAHRAFLGALRTYHETDEHIFVHAGIRPGVPMAEQDEDDLVWIRDPFLFDPRDHGKLVVHGHTAVRWPEAHANRINLDGGAGFGKPLTPAVWDGTDWFLLTENGREPFWSASDFAAA